MQRHGHCGTASGPCPLCGKRRIGQFPAYTRNLLQCSFESKDMLSPEELSAVRAYASEHQLTLRGANAFPQFVSHHPARYPWPVSDQRDIRRLHAALEAALEVSKQVKSRDKVQLGFREGPAHDRSVPLLTRSGEGFIWSLHPLPPKQPVQYPEPILSNDVLLARLRKMKKQSGVWVCDVVLMPQPMMEDDASAPVFPYTTLLIICEKELALPTEVISDYDSESETLLLALGNRMLEHGIPREIRVVDDRTYALLKNLASALKIRLVLHEENALLDEMEMEFFEYASAQTADTIEVEAAEFVEMLLSMDDDRLLSIPNELWEHLGSLEQQGMLDEAEAQRLRELSKRKR